MQSTLNFFLKFGPVTLMLVSSLFAFLGDYFAKSFSINLQPGILAVCLFCFLVGDIIFVMTLFQKEFVLMNMIWNLLNISLGLIIGFVMFKEHVTTMQGIGITVNCI